MTTPDDLTYYTCTDQRMEQSAIELEIVQRLEQLGVAIVPQVKLNGWVFDGAVTGTRVLVEIHGDYWHNLPVVKERDERKLKWAAIEGYEIVTIWESEYQKDGLPQLMRVVEAVAAARKAIEDVQRSASEQQRAQLEAQAEGGRSSYGDWRDRFLGELAESGIVRRACLAAGVSRKTAYHYRSSDTAFAEDWKIALQDAADAALDAYRRRGFQQSDRAMEFFIRSRDPEAYGQTGGSLEIIMKYLDLSKLPDEQLDQIAAGADPWRVIIGSLTQSES